MNTLINGFLNVSRLESGKIHLNQTSFELNDLIAETIDDTKLLAKSHPIEFAEGPKILITADKEKLGTVISNLLNNAVKYSPIGTLVTLSTEQTTDQVIIRVKDQGKGIQAHDLEKLFERYYRVESSENKHISGFGIGLYLSAEIIKRHEGKIWAESKLNEGTTFTVSLPLGS
ncbi:Sensor histidine kinase YycG [compost metagenome]